MPRTTEAKVRDIISSDSLLPMLPHIVAANLLTNWVDTCDTGNLLSATHLTEIETWLAAHYYEARDSGYDSKKTGDASAKYQGKYGLGLLSSKWGQRAISLDVTGCLAQLNADAEGGRKKASLFWAGKPPSDQIDYEDRD